MIKRLEALTLDTLADHMVEVKGGGFEMGAEDISGDEKPIHKVHLSTFEICRYPVTQALWEAVIGSNPAHYPHPQRPVEQVSWYSAVDFCNRLTEEVNQRSGQPTLTPAYQINRDTPDPNNQREYDDQKWTVSLIEGADGYRLPTEAEWEYAARGGPYAQPHAYAGSPNRNEVAQWDRNSHALSQPVGLKPPNALGLCDLSGNVWEWVWDWYAKDYYQTCAEQGTVQNPTGPPQGSSRGVRGGSWGILNEFNLRVALRYHFIPFIRYNYLGVRLCRYPRR